MTNQNPLSAIPACAWQRPIGLGWDKPYTVRYASNLDDGPWHGMPLGGFGAGCIGRSSRGDFNLWHIDGGEHVFQSIPACQFSVFEQVGTATPQAYALCTERPTDGSLSEWQWYPQQSGTYHALYPRSWFVYSGVFQAELTCQQFSPIWAHNYQEASYPIAVFEWTAHNPTDQPITLSIMLTWQNMVGWFTNANKSPDIRVRDDGSPVYEYQPRLSESQGNFNQWVVDRHRVGCLLDRVGRDPNANPQEGEGQWAIASLAPPYTSEVFYHTRWNPDGTGAELWQTFAQDGSLADCSDEIPAAAGEQVGAAIAIRFTLAPGESRQIPFVLAWDFPVTEFAAGVEYYRRYTDFFGRSGQNAWSMARTALKHYEDWNAKIQAWQQPILERADLPNWFKMALFNELYDLTDGGALWSAASDRDPIGQFAVLECIDYRWYESLDVRLYGSFGLLMLWPELEKSVMRAFARAIPAADDRTRVIGYYYTIGAESPTALRKIANATPHDLGAPNEHVWEKTNYTSYQDCNLWKDLPSDFVLQVYRDYLLTGANDVQFLEECWPSVVAALAYLKTFDLDGDGIPENSGAPDQTFDDWRLQGISAYCGALWIAALEAAIAIGQILINQPLDTSNAEIEVAIATYQTWLAQARPLYQAKLWNGQYYRLDSESGSDVVMADQLCGQFYARLLSLPDVVPLDCAQSALNTVYEACFLKFFEGKFGAANGVKPDGSPENPQATHPLEVWTGINFGLAAFLLQMERKAEAFQLTEAVVQQIYTHGLQFRTPEAITANGTFRASHYLRAMAIWAIYGVLTGFDTES
ncbi:GH116 family glycosyl hydrolase [Trichocoleus sp. FACHB-262]|uniref:GH116 family glycosyl hydrolase n=1 Tax=Trichocoleus sp. FACHB-262 TaxID=2692869 RepID=UPI0016877544|nr:GH116 family glycosyl hydrolase [Trichocoleus sp. FACHB-262]MBD2120014.1 bile acid beta-glucosidase [Trichocoleus sp. FACHB-262]